MAFDDSWRSHTGTKIAALVLSTIALNWLSDEFEPTAPILLAACVIALLLLVATQSNETLNTPGTGTHAHLASVRFGLTALLLGALTAFLWLLPWGETRSFDPPILVAGLARGLGMGSTDFYNYELGAGATVAALASIAILRRAALSQVILFVASCCLGVALMIVSLRPHNSLLLTFAAWSSFAIATVLVVSALPGSISLLWQFFNPRRSDGLSIGTQPPQQEDPDRGSTADSAKLDMTSSEDQPR